MVCDVPQAGRDGAVERKRHEEQEAGEAAVVLDLRVCDAKAARLKIGEHRLDPPSLEQSKVFA